MEEVNHVFESQWNPVNLGKRKDGGDEPYTISTTHVSSSWYSRVLDNSGVRKTRLRHFFDMDKTVEIAKALDILAEDISSENADNEAPIELCYDEHKKFLKSTIKLLEGAKDTWLERTKFDRRLFERVRETLKYGSVFFKKNNDGTLTKIPAERIVGYVADKHDPTLITHYIEDPDAMLMEDMHANRRSMQKASTAANYNTHPVDSLLIMKVGNGPYGTSVLETVFKVWRQQVLIEDAIVIYRVTRAAEKRVYYIDTGNLAGPRRTQAIEQQRLRLMQKQTTRKSLEGGVDTEYDPHSTVEDIFIPTNSQGKGSRVEVLPGGAAVGETRDLDYFVRKLASGLRIPASMIDAQADQERSQFSDMRVGTIYAVEMRYLGHVKRIARVIAYELNNSFHEFCLKRNVVVPEGIYIKINDPNSFAKYKELEVAQQSLNIMASTTQISSLAKKYVLERFMFMDEEELIKNEEMKLIEMGLTSEQIKEMPDEHIQNIVYGDGRLGEKYGIAPPEQQPGYGGF